MRAVRQGESGQTVVEFALICIVFLMFTAGLIDVGRAFYQYNAMASAARYAARWGSVVGGTCVNSPYKAQVSSSDWCVQLGDQALGTNFWLQNGNKPLQPYTSPDCPTTYDKSFAYYYKASDYVGGHATTVVGAVAQRFDTNGSTSNIDAGSSTPGFDLSQLRVCVQQTVANPTSSSPDGYDRAPGTTVSVSLYYPFTALNTLVSKVTFNLIASSQFVIE